MLLVDQSSNVHVVPSTDETQKLVAEHLRVQKFAFHQLDFAQQRLQGFALISAPSKNGDDVVAKAIPSWTFLIPSSSTSTERLISLASHHASEKVHSSMRVAGVAGADNRNLVIKYLNPNLIVLATEVSSSAIISLFVLWIF
jgi:hypothetical protein